MLLQSFLQLHGLAATCDRYKLVYRRHCDYPNLVSLKYDIDSDLRDPLVQEARGIIVDESKNWDVVARPFDKFFNHGEVSAANIDWRTAVAQEKLDGSLMIMYFYDNAWQVATSGTPDASGDVNGLGFTFDDLFWETWVKKRFSLPYGTQEIFTYMFELTSPFNRIVVQQKEANLRLIGLRNRISGAEIPIIYRSEYDPVRGTPVDSIDDVQKLLEGINPVEQEGYVIVDYRFRRIKVKHPGYVALHHLRGSFSLRRIVEIVIKGETDEVLAHFPEWTSLFQQVRGVYDGFVTIHEQFWRQLKDIPSRKDFAEQAKRAPYPPILFMLRDGKTNHTKEALKLFYLDTVIEALGIKDLALEQYYYNTSQETLQ